MELLISRFIRFLYRPSQKDQGFTLIELLVTALIGSVIVTGLLYLTNELLTTDNRESTKTETQRDLNLALDFISAELREAVYIYPNAACLLDTTPAVECDDDGTTLIDANQVALPANSGVPVLAFWKQEELDAPLVSACGNNPDPSIPCIKGNAYSLVVYTLNQDIAEIEGDAAIYRYDMQMTLDAGGAVAAGYLHPIDGSTVKFRNWPHEAGTATFSDPQLLVDFVDDDNGATLACPSAEYQITPSSGGSDSFYACVKNVNLNAGTNSISVVSEGNQDVVVRLRGNARNRSSLIGDEAFLPVLESHVSVRGAVNRQL